MGLEGACQALVGKRQSVGRLLLETDSLIFRGEFRLAIALREITSIEARNGTLQVRFGDETASFVLGPRAENWAARIRSPRSRIEKLGITSSSRVSIIDLDDDAFLSEVQAVTRHVSRGRRQRGNDAVFFGATSNRQLSALTSLRSLITPDGAIWVVRPKGRQEITEAAVMAAGKRAGLVDVKVVRFSETHTAEKFVVPRKDRKGLRVSAGRRD